MFQLSDCPNSSLVATEQVIQLSCFTLPSYIVLRRQWKTVQVHFMSSNSVLGRILSFFTRHASCRTKPNDILPETNQ